MIEKIWTVHLKIVLSYPKLELNQKIYTSVK